MHVVQLLPTISYGDAVGNDTLAIQEIIRQMGYETQIYAENIDGRLPARTAMPFSQFPTLSHDDVVIYHGSTGTDMNFRLPQLGGRKIMIYHNITPPDFFQPYSPSAEQLTAFYIDPTHNKPIHPAFLNYILKEAGFSAVQIIYTDASRLWPPLPHVDSSRIQNVEEVNRAIDQVSELLFGSLDYAVIAKK